MENVNRLVLRVARQPGDQEEGPNAQQPEHLLTI